MPKGTAQPRYAVIIQWSDEDQCYVVSLPEWGPLCKTQGKTYEEAAKNAQEVLELLMEPEDPPAVHPVPMLFQYPGANVVNLSAESVDSAAMAQSSPQRRQTADV